ncbi:Maf family protein [Kaistia dalseonensis]|uniref:Nucleoside triphosphate pyrophosphatase n=1 Tax=Kaistia dalseonensis TaxID=410840 RepID=A0ABU0H533_9HYPH|nr:Maf family protein [Kaistia dalseonensis]MCX5494841.1 Maf family protein [Kaistia dalseonensis]MDQ0437422.1 septum formation protein [Kaistia dalseonensis]
MTIILASTSKARRALLANAGIAFEAVASPIDERAVEAPLLEAGVPPSEIAQALADAKALGVSVHSPGALVIGSDQVLDLDGERFVKPVDLADAGRQIARLAGRPHHLRSAVTLARDGVVLWRHLDTATLTMRPLDQAAIERYLAAAGDDILWSVGGYMLEGVGIQLFSAIEGDYFSILGLPLLPLLGALRDLDAISN